MFENIIECYGLTIETLVKHSIHSVILATEGIAYSRKQHYYLDVDYLNSESKPQFEAIKISANTPKKPIYFLEFHRAKVFGQGSILTEDGSLVANTSTEFLNHGKVIPGSIIEENKLKLTDEGQIRSVSGTSLLVKRPWYTNHGHWLIDLMPIIEFAKVSQLKIDNIIFGDVPEGNTKRMMTDVAYYHYAEANKIFMSDGEVLYCERLYYLTPVHVPPLFKNPHAINKTISLARRIYPDQVHVNYQKIYVSRKYASSRKVVNETELENLLQEFGFRSVYPERMTIEEQISVFSKSDIIVGVKGAALANCIFCSCHAHVIVLTPSRFIDPFFWDIVSQQGANYSEIYCQEFPFTIDPGPSQVNLLVDIKKISSILNLIDK